MATQRTTKTAAQAPARERLTREAIVTSALALADTEGLDAVTIRRLATDHGVTPMALYWHFVDKERLLDGLAARVLQQVRLGAVTADAGSWDEQFRELLDALLTQLRAHPAVAGLIHTRIMLSEAGLELTERALGLLVSAGFSVEQASQIARQALSSMVILVTTEPGLEVGLELEAREQQMRTKRSVLQALSPDRYPHVVASADSLTGCTELPDYFDFGLDLFIRGVRDLQSSPRWRQTTS